jgi:hypothetical protein
MADAAISGCRWQINRVAEFPDGFRAPLKGEWGID